MQAPEVNKVTCKYLYKYRCRSEHLDSAPTCQRLAKLDHPVQQTQFENFQSTLNYWRKECYKTLCSLQNVFTAIIYNPIHKNVDIQWGVNVAATTIPKINQN